MISILLFLFAFWIMLVFQASRLVHTLVAAVFLIVASWSLNSITLWLLWPLFVITTLLLHIAKIRKPLLTQPILSVFRKIKPKLSATEQAALNAGDVWWDGDLFSGRPNWNKLLSYPPAVLSDEEQAFINGPVENLCELLDDWKITHELKDLPPEAWEFIKSNGFFALIIPKQYGGLEFSAMANSCLISKLAARSLSAAVTVMVPNSLGPAELLLHYGTEDQRNYYLPRLARGEEIPCFALTGPEAGSDAASLPDSGVICRGDWQGKNVLGIRLNWEKRYITLGPVATLLGLAFRLYDPDHLLGDVTDIGITCALVPVNTPGIDIGKRHNPLNVPFMNGPNSGRDVFIPVDQIIGGVTGAGKGWQMLMDCLSAGRAISLPALSLGAAKLVARNTGAYARVRRQFNLPIGHFEGIEEVLTRIAGETWVMTAARNLTCSALDQGFQPSVISAIVKLNLTERMRLIVNDGMDIEGGKGICTGPSNHLASAYQAIPIGITVEGANILTRTMIIFGQGAIRCHPWILKELQAADNKNQDQAIDEFDFAFFGHIAFSLRNAASALFYGLTSSRFVASPTSPNKRFYQHSTRFSTAFALTSDLLMGSLGGNLKRKEKQTGRMADILSELYMLSAALKYAEDHQNSTTETALLHWNVQRSLARIQESLLAIMRNLPLPLHLLLRGLIFPLGAHFTPPNDTLGRDVATTILEPGEQRDQLTAGLYSPTGENDPEKLLEEAFILAVATDPLEKKLRQQIKKGNLDIQDPDLLTKAVAKTIISADESELLIKARELRRRIIAVDAF
ncbi:acyl-CoA dehydrogenase [Desulfuromusa kysingii]|uniref:Acyl-coenzyme A dehydrogenase n=1 Tax=Desulfuromusa kysingii TaxID=37625 RepID=A0A1H4DTB8_9BACT|nr:acyl-CoA dehydrogenase [Desulfuromusa kysingii]SEA75660.1 acyl-CoA dehydrogenase [Desulfuromusa kysingii]